MGLSNNKTSDTPAKNPQTPPSGPSPGKKQPKDANRSDPRLSLNRACIYERQLPGDAYITANVQRLQHGFFSSPAVSERSLDHVDFLAVHFVFHAPHTLTHRFKAATIRASIHGTRDGATQTANPRFLMHAPHLVHGAVSPETLQWTFGLAGSLEINELPLNASFRPSGSMNGLYRRYEMMRIQGSVRTLRSPRGREFDVEAGELVWSLEENNLQRSGLPREFTFVMLIQKPHANSDLTFSLDIDPVVQAWFGSYPQWLLSLGRYQPVHRRSVDFRREIGQRFEPIRSSRGFNFASLESSLDQYVNMPGSTFPCSNAANVSKSQVPCVDRHDFGIIDSQDKVSPVGVVSRDEEARHGITREVSRLRPNRELPENVLVDDAYQPSSRRMSITGSAVPGLDSRPLDVRVSLDSSMVAHLSTFRIERSPRSSPTLPVRQRSLRRTRSREALNQHGTLRETKDASNSVAKSLSPILNR